MEWEVLEHPHNERTNDWRASIIVVAAAILALMIFLHSYLLGFLVLIGTGTIMILAHRKPNLMRVILTSSGITAGAVFYPYNTLDGFAVVTHGTHHKVILESAKLLMPLTIIPVPEEIDPEVVHMYLAQYLPEKDINESWLHLILEQLGI